MKRKTHILLLAVIIFLVGLIVVQFLWIYRAAENKQKQFEFAAVVAINKAVDELNKHRNICKEVIDCFDQNKESCSGKKDFRNDLWQHIDSIIKAELSFSKICINYEFKLSTIPHPHEQHLSQEGLYKCFAVKSQMQTSSGKNIWLHISFPGRDRFILAQIGWLFIISISLIILTIGAFILIYRYYTQEQKLATDTRNFINNLTHEFKTPISSIRLANNRIKKQTTDSQNLSLYTNIISQENQKLEKHVNYLLDISRMQKGRVAMQCELTDIHELLRNQASSLKLRLDELNGTLQLSLDASEYSICVDAFHISNVINNLLDNACKYSTAAPDISIATKNINGSIEISIADKGIGIDKSDQKIIFQEFSRVNTGNIHNVKGFGLGLSYVWQVVKMHKGNLRLESEKGVGSKFKIILPVKHG